MKEVKQFETEVEKPSALMRRGKELVQNYKGCFLMSATDVVRITFGNVDLSGESRPCGLLLFLSFQAQARLSLRCSRLVLPAP